MPTDRSRKWDGGYVTPRGVYVIYRKVGGRLYEISTRCRSSRAADAQLKRFEADPSSYRPGGVSGDLQLDEPLALRFIEWSREKGNSQQWRNDQARYLDWWASKFGKVDLRRVNLARDILPALKDTPARATKIRVLKAFYSWLRSEEHLISPAEDPTLDRLKAPQALPEQTRWVKAISPTDFELVREALRTRPLVKDYKAPWVEALDVLAGTGWHVNELVRFAESGRAYKASDGRLVIETPKQKTTSLPHRTEVGGEVFAAAERLLGYGHFSKGRLADAMIEASNRAKVKPPLTPGRLRHSVATWAVNSGRPLSEVSTFLGHKSEQTTRRFYATHAVPAKVPTLR